MQSLCETVTGTLDNLILQVLCQFHEIGSVACHPDGQAQVGFRVFFGFNEVFPFHHIKLHMVNGHSHKGLEEGGKFFPVLGPVEK